MAIAVEEAGAALRIKPAYLLAIEEGRPFELPGATYAVGFVRSYSEYLGLDSIELVRQFKFECAGLDAKPDLTFPMPLGEESLPSGRVLALGAFLAVCAYGVWYYSSPSERGAPDRVTEVPAEFLPSKPAPTGPSKPIPADPLSTDRGGDHALQAGPDSAGTAGSTVVAVRRSHLVPETTPLGSGPPSPETASLPTAPSSVKTVANSPPTANGTAGAVLPNLPGPAAPVAEATTVSARVGAPLSAEPVTATNAAKLESPPATLSPRDVLMTGPSAGVAAEGTRQIAAGLSAPPSQRDDGARKYGDTGRQSRVTLRANADSWIQIRAADHSILFTGVLKSGDTYRVPDLPGLTMRAGNAGGVDAIIDGKPVSPLGPRGAVRNVALSPQSLIGQSAAHN